MIKETMEFLSQYDPEVGATIEKEYHRDIWFPEYKSTASEKLFPAFYYQMDIWQFSSSCSIDGIGGRVDANIQFIR